MNAAVAGVEVDERATGTERSLEMVAVHLSAAHAHLEIGGDAPIAGAGAEARVRFAARQAQCDAAVAGVRPHRTDRAWRKGQIDAAVRTAYADRIGGAVDLRAHGRVGSAGVERAAQP